ARTRCSPRATRGRCGRRSPMAERPKPGYAAPPGFHFEAAAEPRWLVSSHGRPCRRIVTLHTCCRVPSVAEFNRGRLGRPSWWAYCADHMYGWWIEDGQVMGWKLVEGEVTPGA